LQLLEDEGFARVGNTTVSLDARLVVASSESLDDAATEGRFSPALLQRLDSARIDVPPLRDRDDDVVQLAQYFVERIARETETTPRKLSAEAENALLGHAWPGNVRELQTVMFRAVRVCAGDTIQRRHLMFQRRRVVSDGGEVASVIQIPAIGKSLDDITREAIHVTLVLTQGNLSATARILGISRPTLARKMRDDSMLCRSILVAS